MHEVASGRAVADAVQIVSAARAEIVGQLDLIRGDLEGIPRSGFDSPTAVEFQALTTSWTELAASLAASLADLKERMLPFAPADARRPLAPAIADTDDVDLAATFTRLEVALAPLAGQWPAEVREALAEASAQWHRDLKGIGYVHEQIDYLVHDVGSDVEPLSPPAGAAR
ncbi:hypothetical protein [Gulosibacter faecalis]|jgi:hypothetical protein|uniref:Uncharacterized protein n=1 Tax=Gulosibacter faecalis TaxID=272240 RepID=A0ABW5UVM5_9MICO|nr:hypothetical protein [Gulosibacter faecalis]